MENPFVEISDRLYAIEALLKSVNNKAPSKQITRKQEEDLLTQNEAANLLKISKVTLWQWQKRGILQSYRIGTQVRYRKAEVIAALKPTRSNS